MCSVDVAFTGYIGNNIEREGERASELTTTTVHNYTIESLGFPCALAAHTIPPPYRPPYKASKLCTLSLTFDYQTLPQQQRRPEIN